MEITYKKTCKKIQRKAGRVFALSPRARAEFPNCGMDALALVFAVGYGVFMGSYPVPIKAPAVLEAQVHAMIFQAFKSFWVLATSLVFAPIAIMAAGHRFEFSWWGVASAAGWVPSGLCTIYAVTRIGLSMAIVVSCASAAVLSFLVFWLVFDEEIMRHEVGGRVVYIAPVYLAMAIVGMAGLVFAPKLAGDADGRRVSKKLDDDEAPPSETERLVKPAVDEAPAAPLKAARRMLKGAAGLLAALGAGVFSALQYGLINAGKRFEAAKAGCAGLPSACPSELNEQFNNFGSWMLSFGIGAALVTLAFIGALSTVRLLSGRRPPPVHWRVTRVPGTVAGLCWAIANCTRLSEIRTCFRFFNPCSPPGLRFVRSLWHSGDGARRQRDRHGANASDAAGDERALGATVLPRDPRARDARLDRLRTVDDHGGRAARHGEGRPQPSDAGLETCGGRITERIFVHRRTPHSALIGL